MEMEWLIPFIYRKIKRHNVRRKYHCLSDGSKQLGDQSSHNQLYQSHYAHDQGFSSTATPQPEKPNSENYYGNHHRRHNSPFLDLELGHRDRRFSGGNFSPDMRLTPVRQGSIKRFLCISGPRLPWLQFLRLFVGNLDEREVAPRVLEPGGDRRFSHACSMTEFV